MNKTKSLSQNPHGWGQRPRKRAFSGGFGKCRKMIFCSFWISQALTFGLCHSTEKSFAATNDHSHIRSGDRMVFLGDSITHAGHYVSMIEAHLRVHTDLKDIEVINLGLPSETCSGLSEPAHPFPRPNVHDRMDAVFAKARPTLVIACYGMNDGIYYPFSEERFKAYQDGIIRLISRVDEASARLVLLTPPPFDPLPMAREGKLLSADSEEFCWEAIYEDYDKVLKKYSRWILEQRQQVELVIDVRTPLAEHLAKRRVENSNYTMSDDGVHLNLTGHAVIAQAIIQSLGLSCGKEISASLLKQIHERQMLLHATWLTEVGHLRPGMEPGLPLAVCRKRAAKADRQIDAIVHSLKQRQRGK